MRPDRPEARTTTPTQGLEDQLLALVVNHERPDLQEQAAALVSQLGQYTITLKELEDSLLARLANAQVGGRPRWHVRFANIVHA